MKHAAGHWAAAVSASTHNLWRKAGELKVSRQIGSMLRLFQAYVMPAGMYGAQLWGTAYLDVSAPFQSSIEQRRLAFLRRLMGLRGSTDRFVLLHETGCKPFVLYWWGCVLRFYNKLVDVERQGSSPVLTDALASDCQLAAAGCSSCWVAELCKALRGLGPEGDGWAQAVLDGRPLDAAGVRRAVGEALLVRPWQDEGAGAKRTQYGQLCNPDRKQPRIPRYIDAALSRHQVRQIARFRTSNHNLRVETGRWDGEPRRERVCTRCSSPWCDLRQELGWLGQAGAEGKPIDDETHALFDCEATSACRQGHQHVYSRMGDLHWVMRELGTGGVCEDTAQFVAACMDAVDRTLNNIVDGIPGPE